MIAARFPLDVCELQVTDLPATNPEPEAPPPEPTRAEPVPTTTMAANWTMFGALHSWVRANFPEHEVDRVALILRNPKTGKRTKASMPVPRAARNGALQSKIALPGARHSPDFRSVRWFGTDYTFTPMQAAVVSQLWEAWEQETPDVGGQYLLENAGLEANRFDLVFRGHPAWKTMIGSITKGSYRLCEPS